MMPATSARLRSIRVRLLLLEQATAGIEELARLMARNAGGMAAESASETVREGAALKDTAGAMKAIAGIIDDIAHQANLLALNAAIEAARAGQLLDGMEPSMQKASGWVRQVTAANRVPARQSGHSGQVDTVAPREAPALDDLASADAMDDAAAQFAELMQRFRIGQRDGLPRRDGHVDATDRPSEAVTKRSSSPAS